MTRLQKGEKRRSAGEVDAVRIEEADKEAAARCLIELARGERLPLILFGREQAFLDALRAGATPEAIQVEIDLSLEELAGACIRVLRG